MQVRGWIFGLPEEAWTAAFRASCRGAAGRAILMALPGCGHRHCGDYPDPSVSRFRSSSGSSCGSPQTAATVLPSKRPGPDCASTTSGSPICTSVRTSRSVGRAKRAARHTSSSSSAVRKFGSAQTGNSRSAPTGGDDTIPGRWTMTSSWAGPGTTRLAATCWNRGSNGRRPGLKPEHPCPAARGVFVD